MLPVSYSLGNVVARPGRSLVMIVVVALVVVACSLFLGLLSSLRRTVATTGDPMNLVVLRKGSDNDGSSQITRLAYDSVRYLDGIAAKEDGSRTYVEATGNRYSWTRAGDLQSAFTITAGTGNVNTDNVQLAVPATTAMEQAERDLWLADAAAAGVTVGSSLV